MQRNVGPVDAAGRVLLGVGLAGLAVLAALGAVTVPVFSGVAVGIVALVLIVEGATRRCLLYRLMGIDRCPVD